MIVKKIFHSVSLANTFTQLSLFATIFAFKSNLNGIGVFFERSLAFILFPFAIAPDAIAAALSFLSYALTTNRNFGAFVDLFYTSTKTSFVFTAVFANISLFAVNSLFIGAVGLGILYHANLVIYNGYQWFKLSKMAPTLQTELRREVYKRNVIDNTLAVLIGLIALAAIFVTIIFAKILSVPMVAAIGIGAAISLPILGGLLIYRSLFSSQKTEFSNRFLATTLFLESNDDPINESTQEKTPLLSNSNKHTIMPAADICEDRPVPTDANNYYYRAFRSAQLTGDLTTDKAFLEKEIFIKKNQLQAQIETSKQTIKEKIWPQRHKRLAKMNFLTQLQNHLKNDFTEAETVAIDPHTVVNDRSKSAANDPSHILAAAPRGAFQSFFRQVSDTEDLAEAVRLFSENRR